MEMTLAATTTALLTLVLMQATTSRPSEAASLGVGEGQDWPRGSSGRYDDTTVRNSELGDCLRGSPVRDVCERCAKTTRSELAFPLCCEGSVNVRNWCREFLAYTLQDA